MEHTGCWGNEALPAGRVWLKYSPDKCLDAIFGEFVWLPWLTVWCMGTGELRSLGSTMFPWLPD